VRATRLLPAAFLATLGLLATLSLAGCAAGLHDATEHEHATPWVANANVGTVDVRDVTISPANGGSGTVQAYLSMALISSKPDELTGATLAAGGTVTPTVAGTSFSMTPNQLLSIPDPETPTTLPGLAITGLAALPQVGTTMQVTLTFRDAGQVRLQVPVRDAPIA
jgi:copper(I)-binding protein